MVFGVGEGGGEAVLRVVVDRREGTAVEIATAAGGADGECDLAVEAGLICDRFYDVVGDFGFRGERGDDGCGALGDGVGDERVEGGALGGRQRGETGGGDLVGGAAREK